MQPNGTSNTLKFEVGVAQVVAITQPHGMPVKSRFSGDQLMYTLVDGRKMYLEPYCEARMQAAGVVPFQPFEIEKCESWQGHRRIVQFEIRSGKVLEGTASANRTAPLSITALPTQFTPPPVPTPVPTPAPAIAPQAPTPAALPSGPVNGAGETAAQILERCYRDAIDVALAAVAYAESKGLRITPTFEDVRAAAATLCIQQGGRR